MRTYLLQPKSRLLLRCKAILCFSTDATLSAWMAEPPRASARRALNPADPRIRPSWDEDPMALWRRLPRRGLPRAGAFWLLTVSKEGSSGRRITPGTCSSRSGDPVHDSGICQAGPARRARSRFKFVFGTYLRRSAATSLPPTASVKRTSSTRSRHSESLTARFRIFGGLTLLFCLPPTRTYETGQP
jgi:hypothetical protein